MKEEEKKLTAKIKDTWDIKYLREQVFMPFGSAMNAYGQTNYATGKSTKEFLEDIENIFQLCQGFVFDSFNKINTDKGNEIEIPLKKKKENEDK